MEESFPGLVRDTNGQQLLLDGFIINEGRSRLIGNNAVTTEQLVAALQDGNEFKKLVGKGGSKITTKVGKAYGDTFQAIFSKVLPELTKAIQESVHLKPYLNGTAPTNAIRRTNLRMLNLMTQTETGLQLQPLIQDVSIMALADWLAQASVPGPPRSDDDIARKLRIPVTDVGLVRSHYNNGISVQQSHERLAQTLKDFLAISPKADVKNGLTDGLMLSLAYALLQGAEDAGLVQNSGVIQIDDQRFAYLSVNKEALLGKEGSFSGQTTLLSQIILQDESIAGYTLNTPSGNTRQTLLGGGAPTTSAQNDAAKRENAVPQKVNRPMLNLLRHLGADGIVELFANGRLEETLNQNDREAKEGQNQAYVSALETSLGVIEEMEASAQEQNIELEEVKLHREYAFSSVNRMQQQGQYGDQASKLTRELITPYGSVLDMTVPENVTMFRRALAQAFGIKIEKLRPEKWEEKLSEFLAQPAIQSALKIMSDPTATPSDQLIQALKDGLGNNVSMVQVHALQAYANLLEADDLSGFFTHLYVEADGVTDGPTNSLLYMRLDGFDTEMVEGLRRGGLVFSEVPTPLHSIFDPEDGPKTRDTYEISGDRLSAGLASHIQNVISSNKYPKGREALANQSEALMVIMKNLLGGLDFSYTEDKQGERTYTIGRKQLKNPLTVTVYGSSETGIAGKIANEIVRLFYEEVSQANAKAKEAGTVDWRQYMFESAAVRDAILGSLVFVGKNETNFYKMSGAYSVKRNEDIKVVQNADDAVKLTFTPAAIQNLSKAIQHFYVTPMVGAINEGMGSSVNGSALIQKATNFMSVLARNAFTNAIQTELKREVAAGGSMADGLSPNSIKKVLERVAFLFPYMEDEAITVNVKGITTGLMDDKADNSKAESAVRPVAGFKDTSHVKLSIPMPALAGVSGAAYVNISYGDGRMIIEASPNLTGGRLMVFDGINLALDEAAKNGKAINASVLKALQTGTPFQDLNKTFSEMVNEIGLDVFSQEEQDQIVANLTPEAFVLEEPAMDFISGEMAQVQWELNNAVLDEKARQAVLSQVHISSDHMAALATPASTADETGRISLDGLTSEEQAARLEAMFQEARQALVEAPPLKLPTEDIARAVSTLPKAETGVHTLDLSNLDSWVRRLNIPSLQKGLIQRALRSLEGSNWSVVFGDAKAANSFAKANQISYTFKENDYGITNLTTKTIIITNKSSETLAHELIHASTMDKVTTFFSNPDALDKLSHDAVERLNLLMQEWVTVAEDVARLRNEKTRSTVRDALAAINSHLEAGRQAEALNEFMAWNLSNQTLNKLNSNIKVENTLARIAKDVLDALKKLFGFVGSDMASNIQFNAKILMRDGAPVTSAVHAANTLLEHSSRARPDLREIMTRFARMLSAADAGFQSSTSYKPSTLALRSGVQLAQLVANNGFNLTADERRAFIMVVAAYRANMVKDAKLNTQMDIYLREVQEQLNQSVMMTDPASTNPGDLQEASDRIDLLNGTVDLGTDTAGRSLLVPMFVALAATSSTAQTLFNRIEVRNRKAANPGTTLDSWLRSLAGKATDDLMDVSYGLRPDQKIGEQLQDIIASVVADEDSKLGQYRQALEAPANLALELNEKSTKVIGKAIDMTSDGLDFLVRQAVGTPVEAYAKKANNIAQTALNLFHKDKADFATSTVFSRINDTNMPQELRDLFSELLGVSKDNVDILQLVKIARATIHRVRQTYRKLLPQRIVEKFKNPVSQEQMNDIYIGMGQADMSMFLDQGMSSTDVVDLLADPTKARRLLDQKEAEIRRLFSAPTPILQDAADLATLMITGAPPHAFVRRNALAIANRAGSPLVGSFAETSAEVQAVDAYTSLLALSQMHPNASARLSALATNEPEGMSYVLSQIAQARKSEQSRVTPGLKFNVPKGYMPYEKQGQMMAVPLQSVNEYTNIGYAVVGTRARGANEALYDAQAGDRIYVSTNILPPSFKQGIMQTVRPTVFGLDAVTGLSHDNPTGGMISNPVAVKRLNVALMRNRVAENLAPMFNEHGQVYAYERLIVRPEVDNTIETQRNAAVAVGRWIGRQFEEVQAEALNTVLIDRLADRWNQASQTTRQDEFVDLFELANDDPIVADAIKLINLRDKKAILDKMNGKFMVERSLYNQVIGYRSMSIGDIWSGNSKAKEEHREGLANFLTGLFGDSAYRRLVVGERAWTNLMGDARVAIVVKSILVPVINGIANFYQLLGNGIGPVEIAQKSAQKLRETHLYSQNYLRHQALEADLSAAQGEQRPDRVRQIEVEMRKIEDLNKRLSIYPLIKAGEFTQVTEGLTQDDLEMTQSRLWDHVSKLADKLPPAVKTAGRYALVTKDTALFEGLARAGAYTDFVAKAVLYDHLTQKRKLTHEDAMIRLTNEFVNYDLLSGRMRDKAEEVGLIWFWKFKLRSIKVAQTMIRENPLHALLTGFVPGIKEVGSVFDDNALALFTNGRWDNSLGPENALRALSLNPISQLL